MSIRRSGETQNEARSLAYKLRKTPQNPGVQNTRALLRANAEITCDISFHRIQELKVKRVVSYQISSTILLALLRPNAAITCDISSPR